MADGSEVAGARLLPLRKGLLPAQYSTLIAVAGCLQGNSQTDCIINWKHVVAKHTPQHRSWAAASSQGPAARPKYQTHRSSRVPAGQWPGAV
jgi:hypothetical protein